MKKIITSHEYPPIGNRNNDWCAYFEGEEELRRYGWGHTEQEAVHELLCDSPDDFGMDAVKAVNAHDDLVAALKAVALKDSRRYGDDMIHGEFCDIAKAALIKHGLL